VAWLTFISSPKAQKKNKNKNAISIRGSISLVGGCHPIQSKCVAAKKTGGKKGKKKTKIQ